MSKRLDKEDNPWGLLILALVQQTLCNLLMPQGKITIFLSGVYPAKDRVVAIRFEKWIQADWGKSPIGIGPEIVLTSEDFCLLRIESETLQNTQRSRILNEEPD